VFRTERRRNEQTGATYPWVGPLFRPCTSRGSDASGQFELDCITRALAVEYENDVVWF
jgi:hypothetical protein